MYEAFYKHFVELFRRSELLDHGDTLRDFLVSGLRVSAQEVEHWEELITVVEVIEVLS